MKINNKFHVSASGLSIFTESPKKFYAKYFGNDETKSNDYVEGQLVHLLLFQPEFFDEKFIIANIKLSDKLQLIADEVVKLDNYFNKNSEIIDNSDVKNCILQKSKELDYYQNIKLDSDRAIKIYKQIHDYLTLYNNINGRKLITEDIYNQAVAKVNTLLDNESIKHLFKDTNENIIIQHELHLYSDYNKYFGLHGFLDSIKIDHREKIIYYNELKTTSKHISKFVYEIKNLHYDIKIAHYMKLLYTSFSEFFDEGYELEVRFIVIDCYGHVTDFLLSEDTKEKYMRDYKAQLNDLTEAFENRVWGNPMYYKSTIVL